MKNKEIRLNDLNFNPSIAVFGILKHRTYRQIKETGVVQFKYYIGIGNSRSWGDRSKADDSYYFVPCSAEIEIQEPDNVVVTKGETIKITNNP